MIFTPIVRRSAYVSTPRHLDAYFERWLGDALGAKPQQPKASESQDDQAFTLSFDVPGVTKEQITIGIEANVVQIETVADAPRRYKWVYELPQQIDTASSEAKLELGVLSLKLRKQKPVSNAKQLTID